MLFAYFRSGETHLDGQLYRFGNDTYKRVIAAIHFEYYLHHRDQTFSSFFFSFTPLEWDLSKAALVEFIYACFEAKVFKNATLRMIIKVISVAFGQALTEQEVNQKWQEIKARKKEKVIFLHSLQQHLLARLTRQDQ